MLRLALVVWSICALITRGSAEPDSDIPWPYDPREGLPFGASNPERSDPEAAVFDRLIGVHDCKQQRSNYATGDVIEGEGVWTWYYDQNGFGIRDTYRYANAAPASQRIYNAATKEWHVWYFVGQRYYYVGEWTGGGIGDGIVLERPDYQLGEKQVISRLSFFDITDTSFNWHNQSIDPESGEVLFVDWAMQCTRRQ